jgi:hypothetical protein
MLRSRHAGSRLLTSRANAALSRGHDSRSAIHAKRPASSVSAGYGTEGSRKPTMVAVRVSKRICLRTTKRSLCSASK